MGSRRIEPREHGLDYLTILEAGELDGTGAAHASLISSFFLRAPGRSNVELVTEPVTTSGLTGVARCAVDAPTAEGRGSWSAPAGPPRSSCRKVEEATGASPTGPSTTNRPAYPRQYAGAMKGLDRGEFTLLP